MSNKKDKFDLDSIIAITTDKEGLETLIKLPNLLLTIVRLLKIGNVVNQNKILSILINISAEENGSEALLKLKTDKISIVKELVHVLFESNDEVADNSCKVLSNLTHHDNLTEKVIDALESANIALDKIVSLFTIKNNARDGALLDSLGLFFSNISQISKGRKLILTEKETIFQKLLPYTSYQSSIKCRKGIVGMIRNCCFETDMHKWLLSEQVNILSSLLLPLADGTEYDDEENDKLPIELQYLGEEKQREEDPGIRCMLLEAIMLLCSKRQNREYIRSKNAYVILRELHKWEKNKMVLIVCENLVNILIRTEEEIGEDDLQKLSVTEDLQEKFNNYDREILES